MVNVFAFGSLSTNLNNMSSSFSVSSSSSVCSPSSLVDGSNITSRLLSQNPTLIYLYTNQINAVAYYMNNGGSTFGHNGNSRFRHKVIDHDRNARYTEMMFRRRFRKIYSYELLTPLKEYHARVHVRSKLSYFPLIKDRLGLDRCVLFRSTYFRPWLDLTYVDNEEDLIHYMLQKQVFSDNEHYDLPLIYKVNEHLLHFGRREFCLITGFKFGIVSFRKFREGDISFRDRVFPEKIGRYVKTIDLLSVIEDQERFTKLSDEDSIRVCLLLSLEVIFMGRELGSIVDDVLLRMVDDLEAWNEFPWGEHIWRELYAAIRNVNSKHNVEHHKALDNDPNFVPSYSLSGFLLCFKIWILESSSQTDRWWTRGKVKDREAHPVKQSCNCGLRVKALECLCERLLILPKEIEILKERVYKIDSIMHYITWKTKGAHPKQKVSTSVQKDNVDCDLGDEYCSDLDGEFFELFNSPIRTSNKNAGNEDEDGLDNLAHKVMIVDGLDYLSQKVYENGVVDVDKLSDEDLSEDGCVKAEKHAAEIYSQAIQREQRSKLILEEENKMKSIEVLNAPSHLKLALQRCGTTKRRYVNVLRPQLESPYTDLKVPSMDELRKRTNVLHPFMIEMTQVDDGNVSIKFTVVLSWRIFYLPLAILVASFLGIMTSLWIVLSGKLYFAAMRNVLVGYLTRDSSADWSMVSCYFVTLLLQNSMPLFYATDEIYPIAWKNVEQVFIPINEPKQHWSLAHFNIKSGLVTFYDSEGYHEPETRLWYLNMRRCLECKLPAILEQTDVFGSKGINPLEYNIKFKNAHNIPKQGGIFGDCGVFVCLFLYRLSHRMPLAVVDPVQTAIAY
ncbi:phospholipase-like, Aminotransferase-like mobile domain protein [Artemisia annua]|uniref:Phospholipase-like, Aminotransferase-like mobile domain protein n=1 Tax=Artemisia annua TaxID=35608 RepID=A0A2U1NR03_ARTAN|nr:phospholipase-like, Aminotransferase-like mobile domain protein [Artemisia annua]